MVDAALTRKEKRTNKTRTNNYLLKEVCKAESKFKKKGIQVTHGRIIAEQTFGFWISFFDLVHYSILSGSPIKMFNNLPPSYGRKKIYDHLKAIRDFRNRINHNEPICFVDNEMDFSYAESIRQSILDLLSWIDPKLVASLEEFDNILTGINKERERQK
jgi:Abi-like protein.